MMQKFLLVFAMLTLVACGSAPSKPSKPDKRETAVNDYVELGVTYLHQGNRDAARRHLLRAIQEDKNSANAHYGMALLYQAEQEIALAENEFKQSIKLDKRFTKARFFYGIFLFGQERLEEARRQFDIAAQDLHYENRAQVYLSLGVTASRLGDPASAVADFEKALALQPGMTSAYIELAEIYFDQQDIVQARRYLDAYSAVARPSARSLWLGIRLDDRFGNRDGLASKSLQLTKLFPYSEEALAYKEWRETRGTQSQ